MHAQGPSLPDETHLQVQNRHALAELLPGGDGPQDTAHEDAPHDAQCHRDDTMVRDVKDQGARAALVVVIVFDSLRDAVRVQDNDIVRQ